MNTTQTNESDRLFKIAEELERHENFWRNKQDDTYGINLSVTMSINAVRQAILKSIEEFHEESAEKLASKTK